MRVRRMRLRRLDLPTPRQERLRPILPAEFALVTEIAVLVGLKLTGRPSQRPALAAADAEESIEELADLASTAGARVAERWIQTRPRPDSATAIGSGKVEQLKAQVRFHEATLVIFDRDLSPTQQRNLEKALEVT